MTHLQTALDYAKQNHERFLSDLNELITIPSISTDSEYTPEVLRAADWVANHL
jgi:acetylornithine deacetylase/succinyl-diaminopimelate desuccinylase-like protein